EDPDAIHDYFDLKYRGARYSFGYGACPDLESRRVVVDLLEPEQIGVELSEELQLHPEQSTDAFVLYHPEAKYFNTCGTPGHRPGNYRSAAANTGIGGSDLSDPARLSSGVSREHHPSISRARGRDRSPLRGGGGRGRPGRLRRPARRCPYLAGVGRADGVPLRR